MTNIGQGLDRRSYLAAMGGLAALAGTRAHARADAGRPPPPWTSQGFVARAGGRMHWTALGEGEPLVLLHKLGGWLPEWRAIAPLLARTNRVIAIDLPGHGRSAMLGAPPYQQSVLETAAVVRATLDDVGVSRCTLVGSSLGGCVAVVMAAIQPDQVHRLALLSVALSGSVTREALTQEDEATRGDYDARGRPRPRSDDQASLFAGIDPAINAEHNLSRTAAGAWVRASQRGVSLAGIADYLPRVSAPTLLVYAERGVYLPFEGVGRAKLRDAHVTKIANSGSFMHQEQPAATASAIDAFLRR